MRSARCDLVATRKLAASSEATIRRAYWCGGKSPYLQLVLSSVWRERLSKSLSDGAQEEAHLTRG